MSKTKKVTITLTPDQQDTARYKSLELFGKENISGYIGYLIQNDSIKKDRQSKS